jgi:hypothetical protein
MIIVKLQGGLGNQMFQYAFASILSKIIGSQVLLDISSFDNDIKKGGFTPRNFELKVFENNYNLANSENINTFHKLSDVNKIKKFLGIRYPQFYKEESYRFQPDALKIDYDVFLMGYFQSFKYYIGYEDVVQKKFSFSFIKLGEFNKTLLLKVKTCNSVAIHIRRGDYIADKSINQYHGICSIDYYLEAILYIASQQKSIILVFFSDDITWVKEQFKSLKHPTIFVDNNTDNGCIDMFLMSSCKHNIIANSSFSWWAAWLNKNQSKTVICPRKWFNDSEMQNEAKDLIPKEWIRL